MGIKIDGRILSKNKYTCFELNLDVCSAFATKSDSVIRGLALVRLEFNRFYCSYSFQNKPFSRIFPLYGAVTIAGEGLPIQTYPQVSWALSSEGSLACHTYCYTGHPFSEVSSVDLLHSLLTSCW